MAPLQSRLRSACAVAAGLLAGAGRLASAGRGACIESFSDAENYFPDSVQSTLVARTDLSSEPVILQFASLFDLAYGKSFKVVTEHRSKEQYVLTQCGAPAPTEEAINQAAAPWLNYTRKYFTIPLQGVATSSTVQLAFLEDLGLMDRVKYVSKYAVGACWQKGKACNGGYEGAYGNATLRGEQDAAVEAVFADCYGASCTTSNNNPLYIQFSGTQDPGPLHTAEYIKFLAAFFNMEKEANRIFDEVVQAYNGRVETPGNNAPVVAWIQWNSYSSAYQISLAAYKSRFVTHAGGMNVNASAVMSNYPNFTSTGTEATGVTLSVKAADFGGNQSLAAAAFTPALAGVDVVIDETYYFTPRSYTFETFLDMFFLDNTSTLPFITGRKVFRQDATISSGDALDWFESRVAHPERMLSDLKKALSGGSGASYYLRNIAAGETPKVISEGTCGVVLPSCNATAEPVAIPLLFTGETTTVETTTEAPDNADADHACPRQGAAAAVLAAAVAWVAAAAY